MILTYKLTHFHKARLQSVWLRTSVDWFNLQIVMDAESQIKLNLTLKVKQQTLSQSKYLCMPFDKSNAHHDTQIFNW